MTGVPSIASMWPIRRRSVPTLRTVLRRLATRLERGSDHTDRTNLGASAALHALPDEFGSHGTEPTTCLVATLRRFQTLMLAIAMSSAASVGSS